MKEQKITFTVVNQPVQFRFESAGTPVWEAILEQGTLSVSMRFTTREVPLTLSAPADVGDEVAFVNRPYRLELWVNGVLMDEEWPFGEDYLTGAQQTVSNTPLHTAPVDATPEEPSISGSFTNAQDWCPGNGVFVGDCMPYADQGRYHLLYLKDRHHHHSKWGFGAHQWAHISTEDFVHWDIHPMAVEIDDPLEGSVCTGSHISENGRHLLYYTIRKADGSPATIQRSISLNGYHFRKDPDFQLRLSARYFGVSARDPKVIRGEDGMLHMLVTTTDLTLNKGCLAHLVSKNGDDWTEQGNVFLREDGEPECPDYFKIGDTYYLVRDGYYHYSTEPMSGWIQPGNSKIPCGSVPKGAFWRNRLIFAGFNGYQGKYAGTLTFLEAIQRPDRTLQFLPFHP